jgi:hypothetical protein
MVARSGDVLSAEWRFTLHWGKNQRSVKENLRVGCRI